MNYSGSYSDVIIVGAGPAGCACALALKDSGLKVRMIEKSVFPRDKVCGDAIGGRVKTVLKNLDPALESELRLFENKTTSTGWKLFSPKGHNVQVNFINHGYVSKRIDFDNFLFEKVKEKTSTDCVLNSEVVSFQVKDNEASIHVKDGNIFTSKILIACDGAHSSILRTMKPFPVKQEHYSGAVRAYFENVAGVEEGIIEIHLVKNFLPGYFWIFPLKNNISNVGFGMLSSDISKRKIDLKKAFKNIVNESPALSERFKDATQTSDLQGFGLPLGGISRTISGERYLLCGDAASLIDPLNGEGIGNGMLSGVLAAEQIRRCFDKNDFSKNFLREYDKAVEKKLLPELKQKLFFQKLFNRPWLIDFLVKAGASNSLLRNWIGRKL